MVWIRIQSIRYPILMFWQSGMGGVKTKLKDEMQKMVEMCIQV